MLSTITSKGQITIPAVIRKKLGLHNGDKINFILKENRTIEMIPVDVSVKSLKGMVPKPNKAISIEEMDKAIRDYHAGN